MKKFATLFAAAALLALVAGSAFATSLLTESFSYPDGALATVGAPAWAVYSGTPPTDIQVLAGRAVGTTANAPDDHIAFAAQPTNSPTYACFNVIVPAFTGIPKPAYFALLKDAGTTNFFSRVYVAPTATGWTFALSFSSTNATTGIVYWPTDMAMDTQYNVVIKYDPSTLTSTMWVNPSTEFDPSISQTGTGTAISIDHFALRQGAASTLATGQLTGTANWTFSVDNLGVGTTFNDACGQPVPAKGGTWGQLKSLYR
jgi:hypothetical protein